MFWRWSLGARCIFFSSFFSRSRGLTYTVKVKKNVFFNVEQRYWSYHLCPVLTVDCKQLIKQICHLNMSLTYSYSPLQNIISTKSLPCSNKDRRQGPPRQWERPLWGHSSPCTGQVTPMLTSSSSLSSPHDHCMVTIIISPSGQLCSGDNIFALTSIIWSEKDTIN